MNKTITQIYADDSLLVLTGDEKIEMEDPNDSDATKGTTTAAIAALAGVPVSLGDNDISSSNATLSMTTPNAQAVGYRFIVSWHSGDGSNNFQFTDLGSITLNGVLMSTLAIKGEGQGYWQLRKTAVNTWVTDGMPEIWDSDGGNFTNIQFAKCLNGVLNYKEFGIFTGNNTGNVTVTPTLSIIPAQYITLTSSLIGFVTGTASTILDLTNADGNHDSATLYISNSTTAQLNIQFNSSSTYLNNRDYGYEIDGGLRWTTGHPRKV